MIFFPRKPKPQSNHKKNIRPTKIEEHPKKYPTRAPQSCESHQKQGKSGKLCHACQEPKEKKLTSTFIVVSGRNLRTKKEYWVKTKEIPKMYGLLLIIISILVH